MKPIQHMDRVVGLFGDHLQVRFPPIASHTSDSFAHLLRQNAEEAPQAVFCSLPSNPQESLASLLFTIRCDKSPDESVFPKRFALQ